MQSRPCLFVIIATLFAALPAGSHAQARAVPNDRLTLSAWAGGFTNSGGFSHGDSFFQFDDGSGFPGDPLFGGALRYGVSSSLSLGVEAFVSSPDYIEFDRDDGTELGRGTAGLFGLMATGNMTGAPGRISFILSGGAGIFSWDVDEIGGRNTDLALTFAVGIDYRAARRIVLFGDYGWWWVYHEKDENIVSNTVRLNTLRAGIRFVLF